jgi:hypothetical protein
VRVDMETKNQKIPFTFSRFVILVQAIIIASFAYGGLDFGFNFSTAFMIIFGFGGIPLIWFIEQEKLKNPKNASDFLHAFDIKFDEYCFWLGAYFIYGIIYFSITKLIEYIVTPWSISGLIAPKFVAIFVLSLLLMPNNFMEKAILEFLIPSPEVESDEFHQKQQLEIAKHTLANIVAIIFIIILACAPRILWVGHEDLRRYIITSASICLFILGIAVTIAKFKISKKYR